MELCKIIVYKDNNKTTKNNESTEKNWLSGYINTCAEPPTNRIIKSDSVGNKKEVDDVKFKLRINPASETSETCK